MGFFFFTCTIVWFSHQDNTDLIKMSFRLFLLVFSRTDCGEVMLSKAMGNAVICILDRCERGWIVGDVEMPNAEIKINDY